ncbi:ATP-dependent DNA helicase [Stygiomarasmius scandens]|uniref:ATP-dependent DNA helicase n=1 Tax=Marasmiellus scandens TaxID=2682957 RepID=A0ABR1K3N1_9AGAR
MLDQTESLQKKGINAVAWNSDTPKHKVDLIKKNVRSNVERPRLLYVSPEHIEHSEDFRTLLADLYRTQSLDQFVLDEAQSIWMWGSSFRPSYDALGYLRDQHPAVPIMALTGTTTTADINCLVTSLRLRNVHFVKSSLYRPNLQ